MAQARLGCVETREASGLTPMISVAPLTDRADDTQPKSSASQETEGGSETSYWNDDG